MDQIVDVGPRKIHRTERRNKGRHAVVGTGGNLGDPRVGLPAAKRDHVGERAPDIDSDLPTSGHDAYARPRIVRLFDIRKSFLYFGNDSTDGSQRQGPGRFSSCSS